jgi:catechol 2,3-dioxygenase-like lactoylglutathione lyase family enzyme
MRKNARVPVPLSGRRPHQIGILVRDIEAAVAKHEALVGPQDWIRVHNGPHNLHGLHYKGQPADYSMLLALSGSDPQLELLQPLEGPSILQEWLDRRGEGLHHLGIEVESVDATIVEMEAAGYASLQHGYGFGADGSGAFAYFDTEAELGYLLEAIEPGR